MSSAEEKREWRNNKYTCPDVLSAYSTVCWWCAPLLDIKGKRSWTCGTPSSRAGLAGDDDVDRLSGSEPLTRFFIVWLSLSLSLSFFPFLFYFISLPSSQISSLSLSPAVGCRCSILGSWSWSWLLAVADPPGVIWVSPANRNTQNAFGGAQLRSQDTTRIFHVTWRRQ
jgi:hypothetical protein